LNCKGVIRELSSYIDDELDVAVRLEIEGHLADCGDCALVVDQTKRTVEIFCGCEPVELPEDVKSRLHEALRKKIKKTAQ
jgi:anti-sigma factor RsiW